MDLKWQIYKQNFSLAFALYDSSVVYVSPRYLDRIIRGPELHEFANMLMPHQKATTADG